MKNNNSNVVSINEIIKNISKKALMQVGITPENAQIVSDRILDDPKFVKECNKQVINSFMNIDNNTILTLFIDSPEDYSDYIKINSLDSDRNFMLNAIICNKNTFKYVNSCLLDDTRFLFDVLFSMNDAEEFVDLTILNVNSEKLKLVLEMYDKWMKNLESNVRNRGNDSSCVLVDKKLEKVKNEGKAK